MEAWNAPSTSVLPVGATVSASSPDVEALKSQGRGTVVVPEWGHVPAKPAWPDVALDPDRIKRIVEEEKSEK